MLPIRRMSIQSLVGDWEKCDLNRVFLTLSAGFFGLMLAISALAGLSFSPGWFAKTAAGCTMIAGGCVTVIALRRIAPWLSWGMAFALPFQTVVCLFFGAGLLKGAFSFSDWQTAAGFAWVGLVLASGWGILRNRWWGYFGEAAVITAGAGLLTWRLQLVPGGGVAIKSLVPLLGGLSLYLTSTGRLLREGFVSWNEERAKAA
jgi:hypothetical protein